MAQTPDRSEDAESDLVERLDGVSIPRTPDLPPVPELKFNRPGTHTHETGGHSVTVRVGDDPAVGGVPSKGGGSAASLGAAMGAGVTFAASIVVGFLIGQWIDKKFGFAHAGIPWGTLVMTLAGMAAGFVNLFKLLAVDDKRNKRQ